MTGTRELAVWENVPVDRLRARWRLPELRILDETGSTNDVARALADAGAPAGLLVMAEHQSLGRGRMGRQWSDSPGQSLLFSVLLRPAPSDGEAAPGTAPVRVGLAAAQALRSVSDLDVRLKWPNDLVVPGHGKIAGILCEAATADGGTVVIAGIGINVAQRATDWPPDLAGAATSFAIAAGSVPSRIALMDALCNTLHPLFTRPLRPLSPEELDDWNALDALRDRTVRASGPVNAAGTARGIDPDGALILETADGVRRVVSGSVRATDTSTSTAPADP